MAENKLVNGELLKALSDKIESALSQKQLSRKDRMSYEVQQLLVLYLMEDHPKVREMWTAYYPLSRAALVAIGVFITASATRFFGTIIERFER